MGKTPERNKKRKLRLRVSGERKKDSSAYVPCAEVDGKAAVEWSVSHFHSVLGSF